MVVVEEEGKGIKRNRYERERENVINDRIGQQQQRRQEQDREREKGGEKLRDGSRGVRPQRIYVRREEMSRG